MTTAEDARRRRHEDVRHMVRVRRRRLMRMWLRAAFAGVTAAAVGIAALTGAWDTVLAACSLCFFLGLSSRRR